MLITDLLKDIMFTIVNESSCLEVDKELNVQVHLEDRPELA